MYKFICIFCLYIHFLKFSLLKFKSFLLLTCEDLFQVLITELLRTEAYDEMGERNIKNNVSILWVSQVVLVVKNPPANAVDVRDEGLIPGSRRSPA